MSQITPELEAKIQKRIKWQEGLQNERKAEGLSMANKMREGYIAALKWVLEESK
jgi:hypothetical protein